MRGYAAAAVLLLVAAGCSDEPAAAPSPTASSTADAALDWRPVPGPPEVSVTTDGTWSITHDDETGNATVTGPDGPVADPVRGPVSDVLLSDAYAVVVHQRGDESRPATALVVRLADGTTSVLDAGTPGAPTTSGGSWSLDGGRAAYATRGPDNAYCLAEADLAGGTARVVWCAPPRQGFNAVHLSAAGDAMLVFDDAQPSCRTLVEVVDDTVTPWAGVTPCVAWEGEHNADGAVWSTVDDPERVEAGTFHARVGDRTVDLGPGTSGTLTTCGDAAYFVRDPQTDTDPARLMRWRDGELDVVHESGAGRAFLGEPRCGGDTALTLTAYSESGDEQVTVLL